MKWFAFKRNKQTAKKQVPTKTWKPWNPVAIKKVDPYTESAIVKLACKYSNTWKPVKSAANNIVAIKLLIANVRSPVINVLWQTVTVAPDVNKINVFNKGTSHGLNVSIPKGGHTPPISIAGDKLEWKNAQKKRKKHYFRYNKKNHTHS